MKGSPVRVRASASEGPLETPGFCRPTRGSFRQRRSAAVLACLPRPFLGSGCPLFTTGLPLVPCMHLVEVRNVFAGRITPGIRTTDGLQRLLDSFPTFRGLVHVCLPGTSYPESALANPGVCKPLRPISYLEAAKFSFFGFD